MDQTLSLVLEMQRDRTNRYKHYPEEVKWRARSLKVRGWTLSMISIELGIPRSTIQEWTKGSGRPGYIKTCACCGESFIAQKRTTKFCQNPRCWTHSTPYRRRYGKTRRQKLIKAIEEAIPYTPALDDPVWNYKMRKRQKRLNRLLERASTEHRSRLPHLEQVFQSISQPARLHD